MSYQKLEVYKKTYKLAVLIHKLSLKLPNNLQFDLGDQLRRALRSIPSNIIEGMTRNQSDRDKVHFLRIALGSNNEVLFNLKFLRDVSLLNEFEFKKFFEEYTITGKQIYCLIESLNKNNKPRTNS